MKHLFIVSSAINNKNGEFDCNQQLLQTYLTLKSIYDRVPDARVAVIESSGIPLEKDAIDGLHNVTHCLIDMSRNETVKRIHTNTANGEIAKDVCELLCFSLSFQMLEDNKQFEGIDRVHKISGRYTLNNSFDKSIYEIYTDKVVVEDREESIAGANVGIPYKYNSNLWSWPMDLQSDIKSFYTDAMLELKTRIPSGKYADIGHLMYELIPTEYIQEVPVIGVEDKVNAGGRVISI